MVNAHKCLLLFTHSLQISLQFSLTLSNLSIYTLFFLPLLYIFLYFKKSLLLIFICLLTQKVSVLLCIVSEHFASLHAQHYCVLHLPGIKITTLPTLQLNAFQNSNLSGFFRSLTGKHFAVSNHFRSHSKFKNFAWYSHVVAGRVANMISITLATDSHIYTYDLHVHTTLKSLTGQHLSVT